jgi:hypothetical protein
MNLGLFWKEKKKKKKKKKKKEPRLSLLGRIVVKEC